MSEIKASGVSPPNGTRSSETAAIIAMWGQCPYLGCPNGALTRVELVEHLRDFHEAVSTTRWDHRV